MTGTERTLAIREMKRYHNRMQEEVSWRVVPLPPGAAYALCSAARSALWEKAIDQYCGSGPFQENDPTGRAGWRSLSLHPLRALETGDVKRLIAAPGSVLMKTLEGADAAWIGCAEPSEAETVLTARRQFWNLRYPWELLEWSAHLLNVQREDIQGYVYPSACVEGVLKLGEGSVILPGTMIEGPVSIGKNCRIGPHAFLRGGVTIGDNCVVGHAVELKHCILGDGTHMAHLSYAGDSIFGLDVNIGAGSVFSNYRHDGGEHCMILAGKLVATGRCKLGGIIGDHARIGANTTMLPGRVLGDGSWTLPGEVVR